jgi:hypothetical protein
LDIIIALDLIPAFGSQTIVEAIADMSFQREWELLLAALQRNDASVTSVDVDRLEYLPSRYGRSLGSALRLNTMVTSLTLNVVMLPPKNSDNVPFDTNEWASLLRFIATSPALATVRLRHCADYSFRGDMQAVISMDFVESTLHAVGRNANIRALRFEHGGHYDRRLMVSLVSQSTSLQELELAVFGSHGSVVVAEALVNNDQISDLTLHVHSSISYYDIAERTRFWEVLCQNVSLQRLDLNFNVDDWVPEHMWSSLFENCIHLRRLGLTAVHFDDEKMNPLLTSLISRRDSALDLKLVSCSFQHGALDELAGLLPTIRKRLVSKLTVVGMIVAIPDWICWSRLSTQFRAYHLSNIWPLVWKRMTRVVYSAIWLRSRQRR